MPQAPSRKQTHTPQGNRADAAGIPAAAHHFGVDDVVGHDLGHLREVPAVPLAHAHRVRVQLLVKVVQQPDRLHDHRVHLRARALPAVRPPVRARLGRASSLSTSMRAATLSVRGRHAQRCCTKAHSSTRRHVRAARAPSETHAECSEVCSSHTRTCPPNRHAADAQPCP